MNPNDFPAFPCKDIPCFDTETMVNKLVSSTGLTMRDYFAAKAMAALIAALATHDGLPLVVRDDVVADRAYDMADAMLEARK